MFLVEFNWFLTFSDKCQNSILIPRLYTNNYSSNMQIIFLIYRDNKNSSFSVMTRLLEIIWKYSRKNVVIGHTAILK